MQNILSPIQNASANFHWLLSLPRFRTRTQRLHIFAATFQDLLFADTRLKQTGQINRGRCRVSVVDPAFMVFSGRQRPVPELC